MAAITFSATEEMDPRSLTRMTTKQCALSALVIACVSLAGWKVIPGLLNHKGEVHVLNKTTELVSKGQLEICGQHFEFGAVKPGESKLILFKVRSDSHYSIRVEFESKRMLSKDVGYVTNGCDFKDTLIVGDHDIILSEPSHAASANAAGGNLSESK